MISAARYEKLMAYAQARGPLTGYYETHHIVPRSEGGSDNSSNLVKLTAREHFLAHWLLFRMRRTKEAALAFRLMVNDQGRRRGRDYATARELMANAMRGDKNPAKRPEVRAKIKANHSPNFKGKKRPDHSAIMKSHSAISGPASHWYGTGAKQLGALNHMACKVVGVHIYAGVGYWPTMKAAAKDIGVSLVAVSSALARKGRSGGWRLEKVA